MQLITIPVSSAAVKVVAHIRYAVRFSILASATSHIFALINYYYQNKLMNDSFWKEILWQVREMWDRL